MFGAFGRWMSSFWYLITGKVDSSRRGLDVNPNVVRARYDAIVRDKTGQIQQYKLALASLIAQQESKVSKVKTLTQDVERLEQLKAGALAKARQNVKQLQAAGKSEEQIKTDADYQKCLGAYNDFSSTLAEKRARIDEIEQDIGNYRKNIQEHKLQLQQLVRDLEKLRSEAADAVADIITSKQEKEVADMIAGIAQDGTAEELQRLRQLREEVKAEGKVSKELAGTDTKAQEAEFLEYSRKSVSNSEFDALIGLGAATDAKAAEAKTAEKPVAEGPSKLPE